MAVNDIQQSKAEDFTQIQSSCHLLKCLLTRTGRVSVDDVIVLCEGKNDVLVVKSSIFTVDGNGGIRGQVEVSKLGDGSGVFHICSVNASAKDTADFHFGVGVCGSDECSGGIIDQCGGFDGEAL